MYLKTFKELKTLLPPQSFTYVFIKSENINETFLKKPSFKTSLLFSSLSIPPRCLGKENRVNGTSYPNPRLCPLLKDPAQRMLCRSKQVPLKTACDAHSSVGRRTWHNIAPAPAISSQSVPCIWPLHGARKNSLFLPHLHTLTASQ